MAARVQSHARDSAAATPAGCANSRSRPRTCAASSRKWTVSTPAWATISKKKPPSRSTARSTRPPISSRSAKAAKSSSSPARRGASRGSPEDYYWCLMAIAIGSTRRDDAQNVSLEPTSPAIPGERSPLVPGYRMRSTAPSVADPLSHLRRHQTARASAETHGLLRGSWS